MLKAILFFTLLLPSIFSFATDTTTATTPKPITLTFFELTNKLTAQHKKQLDKVAGFLKKNKEYTITIAAGFQGDKKFYYIGALKLKNIEEYLIKKNKIKELKIDNGFDGEINHHMVRINFYKTNADSVNKYLNDSILFTSLAFSENSTYLNPDNKFQLDVLAASLLKKIDYKLKLSAGCDESVRAQRCADYRLKNILRYLTLKANIIETRVEKDKSQDGDYNTVDINIF